jgi:hypothetical protein
LSEDANAPFATQFAAEIPFLIETYLAPDASDATKAHSLERIGEALESPFRVEHIDAVLDWTRAVH